MRGTPIVLAVLLVALLSAGCSLVGEPFDAKQWRAVPENRICRGEESDDRRLDMVEDLKANHLEDRMRQRAVVSLLGPADAFTRYPDLEHEAWIRRARRNSLKWFGITPEEYDEFFGRAEDQPQEGIGLSWAMGRRGSDCEYLWIRFVDGRLVETD